MSGPNTLPTRLARRVRRWRIAGHTHRLARRLRLLAPSSRAAADATALPGRYRWLRIGTLGEVGEPARLAVCDLLSDGTGAADGLDLVVVPGGAAGGPAELSDGVVTAIIACERAAVPTVLLAADIGDLATSLISVCRDIASSDPAVIDAARAQVGTARAHLLPPPTADTTAWLDELTSFALR
jgi:hypothetical protein